MGIIRHLGLVDGDAVDALDPTDGGTPSGRKRGSDDGTPAMRTTQRCGKLCGDIPPKGRVELLVHDACPASDVCGIHNALRGEACWHGAGVGIEGYGIQVICELLCCTEKHSGPVTGVDELDSGVSGAGKIVGDYRDQHVSTSARSGLSGLRLSAFQVSWS
jgi:hypothetical protein